MHIIFILLLFTTVVSCRQETNSEFVEKLRAQVIQAELARGTYKFEVREIPPLLQVAERELPLSDAILTPAKKSEIAAAAKKINQRLFILTITPIGEGRGPASQDLIYGKQSGFRNYQEALAEFQFGLSKKIWLEFDDAKIYPKSIHMFNNFGMSPGREFVLIFPYQLESKKSRSNGTKVVLDALVPGVGREKIEWKRFKRHHASDY